MSSIRETESRSIKRQYHTWMSNGFDGWMILEKPAIRCRFLFFFFFLSCHNNKFIQRPTAHGNVYLKCAHVPTCRIGDDKMFIKHAPLCRSLISVSLYKYTCIYIYFPLKQLWTDVLSYCRCLLRTPKPPSSPVVSKRLVRPSLP